MYRAALFLGLLLFGNGWAAAAGLRPHDVLAHGDSEHFWVAQVEQQPNVPNSVHTNIYFRLLGEEGKWQLLTPRPIPARVVSLASQNGLAAALLDDGTWMILYPDSGPFTGGSLPAPARMVALAGGANTWWALGAVPGGIDALQLPETKPATHPARAAATQRLPSITSRPASGPGLLVLFALDGNQWKPKAQLAESVGDAPNASLALVDDTPYVADVPADGSVRVQHLSAGKWATDATPKDLLPLASFRMLGDATVPRLWVGPLAGPDRVFLFGATPRSFQLEPIPGSTPLDRAVTLAVGRLRMVALVKGKLLARDFNPDTGAAVSQQYEVAIPQNSPVGQVQQFGVIVVSVALLFAIFGSMRQRPAMRGLAERMENIRIAPLGRRALAGLIDAAPVILAVAAALVRYRNVAVTSSDAHHLLVLIIYWSGGIFYILYNTVIEAVAGRSLGKLLLGLRIIGLDGQPAAPGALITRNVLRLIEVGLFFFPLLLLPFFPLRQRAGDVAAGTLVVLA